MLSPLEGASGRTGKERQVEACERPAVLEGHPSRPIGDPHSTRTEATVQKTLVRDSAPGTSGLFAAKGKKKGKKQ